MTTPTPNLRAACTAGAAAHRLHRGVERGYDVAGQHGRSALARLIRREIARAEGTTP